MRALRDFEAYWSNAAIFAGGGTVDVSQGIRLHSPSGGPPVNGILQAADLDLDDELPKWKAEGIPFGLSATDDASAAAAVRHGMVGPNPLVLVEGDVRDLGTPRHAMHFDVDDFVDILMVTHEIPEFVRESFRASIVASSTHPDYHYFIADDGGPAGCACLFTGAGNAGLYAFGVLPKHRRSGVATSLLQATLAKARELGLKHSTAATTPDGLAFVTKTLGVKQVGVVNQYQWFPTGRT